MRVNQRAEYVRKPPTPRRVVLRFIVVLHHQLLRCRCTYVEVAKNGLDLKGAQSNAFVPCVHQEKGLEIHSRRSTRRMASRKRVFLVRHV